MDKKHFILTYILHKVTYKGQVSEKQKVQSVFANDAEDAKFQLFLFYSYFGNQYTAYYIPEVTDVTETIDLDLL